MSLADGNTTIKLSDLTPKWLKQNYMPGLKFVDECDNEYPDSFFDHHMQNAVRKLETICDITVLPTTFTDEEHDYHVKDYVQWGFLRLFRVPVIKVMKLKGQFPATGAVDFPTSMIQIRADCGQLNLVATRGSLAQVTVGQGGDYLQLLNGGISQLPNMWLVSYEAGFDMNNIPRMIVEAIAKLACIDILTILSDVVRPLGLSSESTSMDGASQSQSYQVPAFQARMKTYVADLYGPDGKRQEFAMTSGLLKQIFDKYRPISLESI